MTTQRLTYAAEIEYRDADTGMLAMLYVASRTFATGAADTPAHTPFRGCLEQPALMRREVFGARTSQGASRITVGELLLDNLQGDLDWLRRHGHDGRRVVIRAGYPGQPYPSAWATVLTGTRAGATWSTNQVSLRLRDRDALLDQPISSATYGGTNVLPDGVDGTPNDLKGKRKPRLYGRALNVAPPCVNTDRQVYQVNDGAADVTAAYHRGSALTRGADYASQAEMLANDPAAGYYRVWPAAGMFRIGLTPTGPVTCDAVEGATIADRCCARIMARIANGPGGVNPADINGSEIDALAALAPYEAGHWFAGDETIRSAINGFAGSVGAWWIVDNLGRFRTARLEPVSGEPVLSITPRNADQPEFVASADDGNGIPNWRARLRYAVNHTVMTDVAGSVSADRVAWLKLDARELVAELPDIKAAHPLSDEIVFDTWLLDAADAQAELTRRHAIYSVARDWIKVTAYLSLDVLLALDLGAVVSLVWPRYDYDQGVPMRVMGIQPDHAAGVADLTLWA